MNGTLSMLSGPYPEEGHAMAAAREPRKPVFALRLILLAESLVSLDEFQIDSA